MHGVPFRFVAFICDFVYFFLKNTRSTITQAENVYDVKFIYLSV